MHVCFVSGEIFAFGKYGGFGRATRVIGSELVQRGFRVSAVVPRRADQREIEELDGIKVYSFPLKKPWQAAALYRQIKPDLYHSQEPSFGTWLAQAVDPKAKHVVTCRDSRDAQDWAIELANPTHNRLATSLTRLYEYSPLVSQAVRRADYVGCAAKQIGLKAEKNYHLSQVPEFLPTPVHMPVSVCKAERPVVCFLSRWDRRKRPELFFELAPHFPHVEFIAAGLAHDADRDRMLREKYAAIPNLQLRPLINQFEDSAFSELLGQSWVFVNTALREGLPNSFIEAAAHSCAILASVDPDGFCSQFGHRVEQDDFAGGLKQLLNNDQWRNRGEAGRKHVKATFELDQALNTHIDIYKQILADH